MMGAEPRSTHELSRDAYAGGVGLNIIAPLLMECICMTPDSATKC